MAEDILRLIRQILGEEPVIRPREPELFIPIPIETKTYDVEVEFQYPTGAEIQRVHVEVTVPADTPLESVLVDAIEKAIEQADINVTGMAAIAVAVSG